MLDPLGRAGPVVLRCPVVQQPPVGCLVIGQQPGGEEASHRTPPTPGLGFGEAVQLLPELLGGAQEL